MWFNDLLFAQLGSHKIRKETSEMCSLLQSRIIHLIEVETKGPILSLHFWSNNQSNNAAES